MARQEKYFVGPRLLADIRRTIARVDGAPQKTSGPDFSATLQDPLPFPPVTMFLGKVTATWTKGTIQNVIAHDIGAALSENTQTPETVVENCVNKFADVEADKWVMVGRTNGRWYLISAEC